MSADLRAVTAQSERISRYFAQQNGVSNNDLHALLQIMVAETAGTPLTSVELRRSMNVSSAAITYLVERMTAADHIRREPDPADRRRAQLRYTAGGLELAARSSPDLVPTCAPRGRSWPMKT